MEKCVCHLNGFAIKDASARTMIEDLFNRVADLQNRVTTLENLAETSYTLNVDSAYNSDGVAFRITPYWVDTRPTTFTDDYSTSTGAVLSPSTETFATTHITGIKGYVYIMTVGQSAVVIANHCTVEKIAVYNESNSYGDVIKVSGFTEGVEANITIVPTLAEVSPHLGTALVDLDNTTLTLRHSGGNATPEGYRVYIQYDDTEPVVEEVAYEGTTTTVDITNFSRIANAGAGSFFTIWAKAYALVSGDEILSESANTKTYEVPEKSYTLTINNIFNNIDAGNAHLFWWVGVVPELDMAKDTQTITGAVRGIQYDDFENTYPATIENVPGVIYFAVNISNNNIETRLSSSGHTFTKLSYDDDNGGYTYFIFNPTGDTTIEELSISYPD